MGDRAFAVWLQLPRTLARARPSDRGGRLFGDPPPRRRNGPAVDGAELIARRRLPRLLSTTTWEANLPWALVILGAILAAFSRAQVKIPALLYWAFALLYVFMAYENLPLNRFGQWQFASGWWIFSGEYLKQTFFADVRCVAITGGAALALFLLAHLYPDNLALGFQLRQWFSEVRRLVVRPRAPASPLR
jgi:hypothetical protein